MINFKKHREFRKRLKSAIKKGTLGLIDIGSSKIVCIIIKFSKLDNNSNNFSIIDLRFANKIILRKLIEDIKKP